MVGLGRGVLKAGQGVRFFGEGLGAISGETLACCLSSLSGDQSSQIDLVRCLLQLISFDKWKAIIDGGFSL